ncbi:MAG: LptF/LptG family permease, partial [Proteobacteria bacterium]|nr:LptF/LptG family permease [Pseudomonadota bacterium]
MNTELFPSRTLAFYLARMFLTRTFAMLLMLVLVLQVLDLLSESGKILAHPGNGQAQIWHYVTLRAPQLAAFFLPYSVLLGTLGTFWPLNQNSEVVAMRAAGLSAHQILSPLLAAAGVVAMLSFTFNETVVTHAAAKLKAWQDAGFGPIPRGSAIRSNIYLADGPNVLFAQTVSGNGAAMRMEGVTWYGRDAAGMVTRELHSAEASYTGAGWRLAAPRQFTVADTRSQPLPDQLVARGITPADVAISAVNADAEDIIQLHQSISAIAAAGRHTAELEGKWWHKLAVPLSCMLMP